MPDDFAGRFLGVLGGMGPMAGAYFMERLTALTDTPEEQGHVPAILWSDPRIPPRPAAHFGNGADPFPWMAHGIRQLTAAGASAIAIPCNSAHLWYDRLQAACAAPILHIVRSAAGQVSRCAPEAARIGLMGTLATLDSRLYQDELERRGYSCLLPPANEMEALCLPAIRLVKENRMDEAAAPAARQIEALRERGAEIIVLGCTELPLAVPHGMRPGLGVTIVDSIDALAGAALAWWRGPDAPRH